MVVDHIVAYGPILTYLWATEIQLSGYKLKSHEFGGGK